jgi:dTDP-glucose 4,6-dehydratase
MFKRILITGSAGFIGANFLSYFLDKYPEYHIVSLDKLTYAGNIDNLAEIGDCKNHTFIKGDICDAVLVEDIFNQFNIDGVIHFAAESHVDNSIDTPEVFIKTNIEGTFNLLNIARKFWMSSPQKYKPNFSYSRFHHISTDEVFGSLGDEGFFTEETPFQPNSPYSASKASSDMIVRSYFHTYGLNVTTSNCSNNYGPKQHMEKLIPTVIRACLANKDIPVYGNGLNIRDWLYVLDHCKAIDLIFHKGLSGETYVVGGNNERKNIELIHYICNILDELRPRRNGFYKDLITYVSDRPGHDHRYAIDFCKMTRELNWYPDETFETGMRKTILWYLENC